jgi:hypothetical protein
MTRLDWDRETREARKRRRGAIPHWADEPTLSVADNCALRRHLEPIASVLDEFARLSGTSRRQRLSEFEYRIRREAECAEAKLIDAPNPELLFEYRRRVAAARERLRDRRA